MKSSFFVFSDKVRGGLNNLFNLIRDFVCHFVKDTFTHPNPSTFTHPNLSDANLAVPNLSNPN